MDASHIEDLKQASSKMSGASRRLFQAEMTLKYCEGNARKAERIFGWNRNAVELGLNEKRTGIVCLGAQKACCGNKPREERHPDAAAALWDIADSYSQQDPSFKSTRCFTRLTASEAIKRLMDAGLDEEALPSPSTMAEILNRNGYRLRAVVKAKPLKKIPETDAIFANIKKKTGNRRATAKPNG
jgi:hypothetical protein